MRICKLYFGILAVVLLMTVIACSNGNDSEPIGTVSLKFKNPEFETGRQTDSILLVNVIIESTVPLDVISDEVTVVNGLDENGSFIEGLVLMQELTRRELVRAGYVFNNATQCWVWGRWITNTETGQTDFQFGSASEQAYHNICAPSGSYYAKPQKYEK